MITAEPDEPIEGVAMIHIPDLGDCPRSGLHYGGRAGQKLGVLLDGKPWILKFPRSGRGLSGRHVPSYNSSPIAEYLSSHLYQHAGIPAHETFLGYRDGKLVCACRDFAWPTHRLVEFAELKTEISDDDPTFVGSPSDGSQTYLSDVLASLDLSDALRSTPGVKRRFWQMFVIDALIKNPDRNNGNWGLLQRFDAIGTDSCMYELAPVYDNGSSLFSSRTDSVAERRLESEGLIEEDAFGTNVSCYLLVDENGKVSHIHPFDYMESTTNEALISVMKETSSQLDLNPVFDLIDEIPREAYGRIILGDATRESHKELLSRRLEKLREIAALHEAASEG